MKPTDQESTVEPTTELDLYLIPLDELAKNYINSLTNKPYTDRMIRNWAEDLGLTILDGGINQHAHSLIDGYYRSVVCVRSRRQKERAKQEFIYRNKEAVEVANRLMADPSRYANATPEPVDRPDYDGNDVEDADGAIALIQGTAMQIQAQANQIKQGIVHATESCADEVFDTLDDVPNIFMRRLARRVSEAPQVGNLSKLLNPADRSRKLKGG